METTLLIVIVVLGAALVVVSMMMLNVVKTLRASVIRLEKRVEGLQAELSVQQQNLDAVRAVLERRQEDPFSGVLLAVDRYRARGLWPTLALVGVRFFKSYLNGKARKKALPVLDKRAE